MTAFLAIMLLMLAVWCVSLMRQDASIVDAFWGVGFVLVTWVSAWGATPLSSRTVCLVAMVTIWGLRLAFYLAWRNWGKPEDPRYAAMRSRHANRFGLVSLVTVFLLQGCLIWIVSLPVQVAVAKGLAWQPVAAAGIFLWLAGLACEAVGDWQLARFKADPSNRGRVLDRGLWRYTRHPNYFGDFLVWWGIYLVAAEPESWWWTIFGPLVMSWLLLRVSGVPLLESSLRNRLEGYDEYVQSTSRFLPLPPRESSSAK